MRPWLSWSVLWIWPPNRALRPWFLREVSPPSPAIWLTSSRGHGMRASPVGGFKPTPSNWKTPNGLRRWWMQVSTTPT